MAPAAAWRAAFVLAALLVLWRVIMVNAVHFENSGRARIPEAAPGDPGAQPAMKSVLRENPAEVVALLVLANELERAGDAAGAGRAYDSAVRLAPMDRDVLQHAAGFQLRHGRAAEGVAHLGRLAEHYGEHEKVFPVFLRLMTAGDEGWAAIVARHPPWLGAFINVACRSEVDAMLLVPLLQARVSAKRAQPQEVECVTQKLRAAGSWEAAYLAWLNTLPRERLAEVGNVFNGSFEHAPTGVGFDWKPAVAPERQAGHAVDFPQASSGAGKRALRVTYNGRRQAAPAILEHLALAPGRYELTGLGRPEGLNSVRGVQWVVRCAAPAERTPLAASERFVGSSEWRRFSSEVRVPPGCTGQTLALEPVGLHEGTVYVAGSAWFDDLRLARLN
jgi:hypothetical protein